MAKFQKLRTALGSSNFRWLLGVDEEVALALEEEIASGGDPEEVARVVANELGETRRGEINRIASAARYLQGLKK